MTHCISGMLKKYMVGKLEKMSFLKALLYSQSYFLSLLKATGQNYLSSESRML